MSKLYFIKSINQTNVGILSYDYGKNAVYEKL